VSAIISMTSPARRGAGYLMSSDSMRCFITIRASFILTNRAWGTVDARLPRVLFFDLAEFIVRASGSGDSGILWEELSTRRFCFDGLQTSNSP
jgi:hypothetical protein